MREKTLKGETIKRSNVEGGRVNPEFNLDVANNYLQDLKTIFDKAGIEFCLFYGTLVGAIREEDFIVYDHDVDVVVRRGDVSKIDAIIPEFTELKYRVNSTGMLGEHNFYYISRPEIPKTKVDIYVLHDFDDKYWFTRYTNIKGRGPTYIAIPYTKKYFDKMEYIDLRGAKYKVPTPPEDFLEELWGDWWVAHGGQFGKIPAHKFTPEEYKEKTQS